MSNMDLNQSNIDCYDALLDNYIDFDFMQLSRKEFDAIRKECSHYANIRAASIEALKIIQRYRGWVSDDAILAVAQVLNISESDVEGVATFYNQIFRQPVGKHIVRYCDSIVCYINGCKKLQSTLEGVLNIKIGNTTQDKKFTLLPTSCLGMCDTAPIIMINENMYSHAISLNITELLSLYK